MSKIEIVVVDRSTGVVRGTRRTLRGGKSLARRMVQSTGNPHGIFTGGNPWEAWMVDGVVVVQRVAP